MMTRVSRIRLGLGLATLAWVLAAGDASADARKSGWLSSAGRSLDPANPWFKLSLSQAQTVTVDLASVVPYKDTYLYLLNASGGVIAQDDDSGGAYNSKITSTLGAGTYYLVAATYSGGTVDDFAVTTTGGSLQRCLFAYQDANYGGTRSMYCDGTESSFANDTYSSFRVPKGMLLRSWEHGDRSGLRRNYFADVPWVGSMYNDLISALEWWDFSTDDFYMATASDTQFTWGFCVDDPNSSDCAQERAANGTDRAAVSYLYNDRLVNAIHAVKNSLGDWRFGGTIINGDLTDFGDQNGHLNDYDAHTQRALDMNVYLGLGNHDYQNNVNDCWQNGCASTMVWYLKDRVPTFNPLRFDYSDSGVYASWSGLQKDHSGSLAYAWEIGNVHFVQLNNYPTYTTQWDGWNFSEARRDTFSISSAIAWLRNDLTDAKNRGKKIILNWHDWGAVAGNPDVKAILNDFPVSAIFSGHIHASYGQADTVGRSDGTSIPVLRSGASYQGTFLVTRYAPNTMYVWVMQADPFRAGALNYLTASNTKVAVGNMAQEFSALSNVRYTYPLR